MVHGLDHEREALRLIVAAAGDKPDADGIAARHEAVAVVLDLINPVRAGRGLVGRGREAGFDELGLSGKPLTLTVNQHPANLGSRSQDFESVKAAAATLGNSSVSGL